MKVRCIKRINPITGEETDSDSWLTIGKNYTVLSLSVELHQGISYRIVADDSKTPVVFNSQQFEIVDPRIPSNWTVLVTQQRLILAPLAWSRRGFWEDFFDGDTRAIKDFEEGKAKIMAEDS